MENKVRINTSLKDQLEKLESKRSDKVLNFKYRKNSIVKYIK